MSNPVISNTYVGNGTTVLYSFTFPYINVSDVVVSVDGNVKDSTTEYSFANATTIQFTTAPASSAAILIKRITSAEDVAAVFFPGSAVRARDLNDNFVQGLYVSQESTATAAASSVEAQAASANAALAATAATSSASDAATTLVQANAAAASAATAQSASATAQTQANNASAAAAAAAADATAAQASSATAIATANASSAASAQAVSDSAAAVVTSNNSATLVATANTNSNAAVVTANQSAADATSAVNIASSAQSLATQAQSDASAAQVAASASQTASANAVTTSNQAASDAATAVSDSAAAVVTSNAANTTAATSNTNSTQALNTANTSLANSASALTASATATTDSAAAVVTANNASATATSAANAVASAVFYEPVGNFADFPSNPSNTDRIEVGDSTGLESQSIITGIPSGFTGSSDLTMRLEYNSSTSKWEFKQYFAEDPEARYIPKPGGTFTGPVNFEDDLIVKGDGTNGSGELTLNCENNSHGIKIKGPPHSAAATYTLTLPNDTGTNGQALITNGSGVSSWSTTVAGRNLSADGTKLDGIETAATADQTKADIDALNINADTLDGQHGSYYTGYTDTAVSNLVDSSPATLDTLNELAAALGDDPNFATTTANSIGTKLPKSGGQMTGNITFSGSQTVDGRDLSADGSKLDGIATGATNVTNTNQLTNGAGFVTSSGNTIIGTDSDIDTSGATIIDRLTMTDGVITSHGTRTLTLANLGYTGATNANYITNNNQLSNGAGYITNANGGNANQLDGIDSSQFLRSDANDTSTGDITFAGGAGAVNIASHSDIRLQAGNWTGEANAKIQYHGSSLYIQYPTNLIFRNSGSYNRITINNNGDLSATGNVTAYSDISLKENIEVIPNALDKLSAIRGVTFDRTDCDVDRQAGVIAQEVEAVLPEVVTTNENGIKSVAYGNLVGLLIESIKELKAEVNGLKAQVEG